MDWLSIPSATRVSKMECARKFAAQMGYVDDFLEAVVSPPEEEAPATEPEEVEEHKLAEGIYVTSSNSPLRKRMIFRAYCAPYNVFRAGKPIEPAPEAKEKDPETPANPAKPARKRVSKRTPIKTPIYVPETPSTTTTKRIRSKTVGDEKKEKVKKAINFEEGEESDPPLERKRSRSSPTIVGADSTKVELDLLRKEVVELKAELEKVRGERDHYLKEIGPVQLALGEARGELKGIKQGLNLRNEGKDN